MTACAYADSYVYVEGYVYVEARVRRQRHCAPDNTFLRMCVDGAARMFQNMDTFLKHEWLQRPILKQKEVINEIRDSNRKAEKKRLRPHGEGAADTVHGVGGGPFRRRAGQVPGRQPRPRKR